MAANEQKITATGGLVVPRLASDPASPSDGATWYNTTSFLFKQRANGVTQSSLTNPMTTAGDVIYGGASGAPTRLAVGAVSTVLQSDGTNPVYGLINNANVGASAAIAYSKLAALTTNRALVSDGGGFVSVSSVTATELGYVSGVTSSIQTQINALTTGMSWHTAVRAYATTNVVIATALENGDTLQGLTLATGDRVALTGQTTSSENGIYVVQASGAAVRASDAAAFGQLQAAAIFVTEGTFADAGYLQITELTSFAGQVWTQIAGATLYTADEVTLHLTGSVFSIKTGGVSNAQVAAAAAIDFSKLASLTSGNILVGNGSNVATSVAVTGDVTITNAGVTAISSGVIVNADINAAANIDATKLGTGSVDNTEFGYLDGVTSAIQTQFAAKLNHTSGTFTTGTVATSLTFGDAVLIHGTNGLRMGSSTSAYFETELENALTLTDNTTNGVLTALGLTHATYGSEIIEYQIREATTNKMRVGRLLIVTNGTDTSITEDSTETADLGVTWNLNVSGGTTQVRYTTTSTGNDRTMRAVIRRLLA